MRSDWIDTTLGDFAPFNYGKALPERDRVPGDVPVISSAGVTGVHAEAFVQSAGIVIGRKGTVGRITLCMTPFWPIDTAFYIHDEPQKRDIRFTYYLLQTLGLDQMNSDSAVPGLNRDNAHALPISIPATVKEQSQISNILSTLDEKIDLNRLINQTLEAMAQAIFKSWFVDFDPVKAKIAAIEQGQDPLRAAMRAISGKTDAELDQMPRDQYDQLTATAALFPDAMEESELGKIPKGWEVNSLDQIATYLNGLALQKFPPESESEYLPVIKIAQLRAGSTNGADRASAKLKPEYIVEDGDVLFSWSGSLEVDVWTGGAGALNQHLFKVTSTQVPKWFYYFATKHYLPYFRDIAANKATTMGHIQRKHLSDALIALAPSDFMSQASKCIALLLEQSIAIRLQSRQLAELRDTLLPKLLSGELSVDNLSAEAETT